MNLVIGATGQLGTSIVRKLLDQGRPVRAFVRRTSDHKHLMGSGADLVFGDLRDRGEPGRGLRGCGSGHLHGHRHQPGPGRRRDKGGG
jgi:uncharacterized protein YbjT (DUF2867 family)